MPILFDSIVNTLSYLCKGITFIWIVQKNLQERLNTIIFVQILEELVHKYQFV